MDKPVTVVVDGCEYEVAPRHAHAIDNLRKAISRVASGKTAEVAVIEVDAAGNWAGSYLVSSDTGFDRLDESLGKMKDTLRKRSLLSAGNEPAQNRSQMIN